MVLPKAMLGYVREDCLILDLASAPGGVDYEAAEEMGIEAILLPGLPGKYAPVSLGECMAKKMIESFRQNVKKKRRIGGGVKWNCKERNRSCLYRLFLHL